MCCMPAIFNPIHHNWENCQKITRNFPDSTNPFMGNVFNFYSNRYLYFKKKPKYTCVEITQQEIIEQIQLAKEGKQGAFSFLLNHFWSTVYGFQLKRVR